MAITKPDYLLYNASTRQTAIWYLSGPTLISGRIWADDCKRLYFDRSGRLTRTASPITRFMVRASSEPPSEYLDNNVSPAAPRPTLPAGWSLTQR